MEKEELVYSVQSPSSRHLVDSSFCLAFIEAFIDKRSDIVVKATQGNTMSAVNVHQLFQLL